MVNDVDVVVDDGSVGVVAVVVVETPVVGYFVVYVCTVSIQFDSIEPKF